MQVPSYENVVKQLNVVVCVVSSISGTVSRDDITIDDESKKIFTSGSVRYIDPVHLRPFLAARMSASRAGRSAGVRFLSGVAVTDEQLPKYLNELKELGQWLEDKKGKVVDNWSELIQTWKTAHPEVAKYSSLFPSYAHALSGIGMTVSIYKINPAETVIPGVEDGIRSEIKGLAGRVIEEIASDARDTWSPGSMKATQKIKGFLNRTIDKAKSLAFLDSGRLGDLAVLIEQTINQLPVTGVIEGVDFLKLSGLMSILISPTKMATDALSLVIQEERPLFAETKSVTKPMAEKSPLFVEATPESVADVAPLIHKAVAKPTQAAHEDGKWFVSEEIADQHQSLMPPPVIKTLEAAYA